MISSQPCVNPLGFSSNVPTQILQFLFKTCCFRVVHGKRDWLKLHAPLDNVHTLYTILYQTEIIILCNNFHRKQNFRHSIYYIHKYHAKFVLLSHKDLPATQFLCDICLFYGTGNNINTDILHCDYMY